MSFWNRVKPNIIFVSMEVALLTGVFGFWLVNRIEGPISSEILALLVGIGIGGLIALAGQLAQDPPHNAHKALLAHELEMAKLDHDCKDK